MAQSFNAITVSLGEAERQKDGEKWTDVDYKNHEKYYNIHQERSKLNTVLKSVNGLNERDVVNNFMMDKMLKANEAKLEQVRQWNDEHVGKINPKTKKEYKKKSVDKRQMFGVGDWTGKGKRSMPYDTFKKAITNGNARAKETGFVRHSVLQQFVVGFGSGKEWRNDPTRRMLLDNIYGDNPNQSKSCKYLLESKYFKPALERFEKENPSLHVVQAVIHYDETSPHMQFTVMPNLDDDSYGGLGSTGFTTCLKHDHPDLPQRDIVGSVYRGMHDYLREQIAEVKPFDSIKTVNGSSDNPEIDSIKNSKMTLGDRPGNHTPLPVDARKKILDDVNRQLAFVAKKELEIKSVEREQRSKSNEIKAQSYNLAESKQQFIGDRDSAKTNLVDTIAIVDPNHTLEPKQLKSNETPEPVSTDEGRKQHINQSFSLLLRIFQIVVLKARELLEGRELAIRAKNEAIERKSADIDLKELKMDARLEYAYDAGYEQRYEDDNAKMREADNGTIINLDSADYGNDDNNQGQTNSGIQQKKRQRLNMIDKQLTNNQSQVSKGDSVNRPTTKKSKSKDDGLEL